MAHVKGFQRVINGHIQCVKPHDDKRTKGNGKPSSKGKTAHVILKTDPGMVKMRQEITTMLRTSGGQKEFTDKVKNGGFQKSLPEVVALWGVEQGAHHPLPDAFDHTMEVIRHLPADASDTVRWAALLHDIGKTETQKFHDKRGIIFDGHEYAGYKMVDKVLDRLGFSGNERSTIKHLVLHHGNLRTKFLRSGAHEADLFMKHPDFEDLLHLHKADVYASGRDPKEVTDEIDRLKKDPPKPMTADEVIEDAEQLFDAINLSDTAGPRMAIEKDDRKYGFDKFMEESGFKRTGKDTYANETWEADVSFNKQHKNYVVSFKKATK